MHKLSNTLKFGLLAVLLFVATTNRSTAQGYYNGDASYQQFYDDLAPYGEWIDDPQYGYVWVPDAGTDFRPYYTNGYWVNTEYGNTWVSDFPWGWATFHYGRWTYSSYYGWTWIPGSQWGPAWVSWRSGGGCFGWAPLGPGVSIDYSFGGGYNVPDYWWVFTPQQYILDHGFQSHSYHPRYNSQYIHQTNWVHNTYVNNHNTYISGPRRGDLENATGHPIHPVTISNITRPDRSRVLDDHLNIYRPNIADHGRVGGDRPVNVRPAEHPLPAAGNPGFSGQNPGRGNGQQQPGTIDRSDRERNLVVPNPQPIQDRRQIDNPGRLQPAAPQQPQQGRVNDTRQNTQPVAPAIPNQGGQPRIQRSQVVNPQYQQQQQQQQVQMDQQRAVQQQQQRNQQQADQQRAQMQQQQQQQQQINQQRAGQMQQIQQQRNQQMQQQRNQQMLQQQNRAPQPAPQAQPRVEPQRSAPAPTPDGHPEGGEGRRGR